MKQGVPEDADIVWVVVCQSRNQPDGPAQFIGPYSDREYAEADVKNASRGSCRNAHYIGHQKWCNIKGHTTAVDYLDYKWVAWLEREVFKTSVERSL